MNPHIAGSAKAAMNAGLGMGAASILSARAENFWKFEDWRRPDHCACEGCRNYRRQEAWVLAQLGWAHAPDGTQSAVEQLLLNQTWLDLPAELAVLPVKCEHLDLAWKEEVPNLVVTEGKDDLLTNYLKGIGYTAAFYVGLIDNAGWTAYAAGDTASKITLAANPPTTNGWQEGEPYSNATRVAWVGGTAAAGSIDNSLSPAAFLINATLTVRGGFLDTASGKHATTGVLYGEADFGTARAVLTGDTLNCTVTCTV
jgi:hypothetical protein